MPVDQNSREIGLRIERSMVARGWGRKQLVNAAGVSASRLARLLAGDFTAATLAKVEGVLPSGRERAAARPEFGGYTAAKAAPYIGRYVLVRGTEKVSKVTKRAGHFEAHGMEIVWDQAAPALRLRDLFFEDEKNGVFGEGLVRMPEGSRYLFVDMVYLGWPSLYILSRMPAAGAAILHGVIVATDLGSAPVVMPAFLKRRDGLDLKKEQVTPRETGLFSGSDIEFQHGRFHREYRTELERIDVAGFLRVLRLPSLGDHLTPPPKGIVSTNR